jgi:hypothetical protein
MYHQRELSKFEMTNERKTFLESRVQYMGVQNEVFEIIRDMSAVLLVAEERRIPGRNRQRQEHTVSRSGIGPRAEAAIVEPTPRDQQ